jgi:hypothetical protein
VGLGRRRRLCGLFMAFTTHIEQLDQRVAAAYRRRGRGPHNKANLHCIKSKSRPPETRSDRLIRTVTLRDPGNKPEPFRRDEKKERVICIVLCGLSYKDAITIPGLNLVVLHSIIRLWRYIYVFLGENRPLEKKPHAVPLLCDTFTDKLVYICALRALTPQKGLFGRCHDAESLHLKVFHNNLTSSTPSHIKASRFIRVYLILTSCLSRTELNIIIVYH